MAKQQDAKRSAVETISEFYAAQNSGDTEGIVALMSDDVEYHDMARACCCAGVLISDLVSCAGQRQRLSGSVLRRCIRTPSKGKMKFRIILRRSQRSSQTM